MLRSFLAQSALLCDPMAVIKLLRIFSLCNALLCNIATSFRNSNFGLISVAVLSLPGSVVCSSTKIKTKFLMSANCACVRVRVWQYSQASILLDFKMHPTTVPDVRFLFVWRSMQDKVTGRGNLPWSCSTCCWHFSWISENNLAPAYSLERPSRAKMLGPV